MDKNEIRIGFASIAVIIVVCFCVYLWVNRYEINVYKMADDNIQAVIKTNKITGYRCLIKQELWTMPSYEEIRVRRNYPEFCAD